MMKAGMASKATESLLSAIRVSLRHYGAKSMPDAKKKAVNLSLCNDVHMRSQSWSRRHSRYAHKLGVRARRDRLASLISLDFEDVDLCEGEAASYLLGDALDFNLLAFLGRALVGDVDVYARTGLFTQVVRRNRETASPLRAS